jgi:uncharacterized DUF497 family protein
MGRTEGGHKPQEAWGRRRILVVVHTEHGNVIRIISARPATSHERKFYEEG